MFEKIRAGYRQTLRLFLFDNSLAIRFTAGARALYRPLSISFISLLFLFWPLIDVRYYFLDDIGRALEGYTGYGNAGRPLADIFIRLLTLGRLVTDIAPAPQLIAVLALALTAALLANRFEITSRVSLAAYSVAVGGSPYFLENMSFRFDSGSMALGVLCSIAPFCLGRAGPSVLAASSAFLFASLCLYQPTINCYPVIALCLMAQSLIAKSVRETLVTGLRFGVPLGLAAAAYWALWKMLPGRAEYLDQNAQLVALDSIFSAVAHFNIYARTVFEHWASTILGMTWAIMAVLAGIILVAHIVMSRGRTTAAKIAAAAFGITLLLLTFPAAVFSLLFLATPVLASRTLVGFVALIAGFSGLLLFWTRHSSLGFLARGLVVMQAVGLVGVTYTYANALRMQERYDDRITAAIVHDIMEMAPNREVSTFVISGWMGRPLMVEKDVNRYPAIFNSVFSVIGQDSYWTAARFKSFGIWAKPAPPGKIDKYDLICRGTPDKSNAMYDLYLVDHTVLIRFKTDGVKCSQ